MSVSTWLNDNRVRPGRQVFAVGDVHGYPAELDKLVGAMAESAENDSHLVLLGDLVDKGPNSPGAIAPAAKWKMS